MSKTIDARRNIGTPAGASEGLGRGRISADEGYAAGTVWWKE